MLLQVYHARLYRSDGSCSEVACKQIFAAASGADPFQPDIAATIQQAQAEAQLHVRVGVV
jgi:hypothetical protein